MKILYTLLFLSLSTFGFSQDQNPIISLTGMAEFDQTEDAFPPAKFTRKIPVPGLIDLAEPKIDQYDLYFSGQQKPMYSWYRFTFDVDRKYKGKFAILKMLKSRYNTQVLINGKDCGTYMQCNTPIDCDLTPFIKYGKQNELLIRIGGREWLPKAAATGFDREKYTDIPGIWDEMFISFGGPVKIHRSLALPDYKNSKITVKLNLENYAKEVERNMEYSEIEYTLKATVREKTSHKIVSKPYISNDKISCQGSEKLTFDMDIIDPVAWSPENPFLYELVLSITSDRRFFTNYGNKEIIRPADDQSWIGAVDRHVVIFGMRDFESIGKDFFLNGEKCNLFGSTLTLNRFFEDRDRAHLPWDKEWVEKLMVEIPKALRWNFFRVSIGLLPDFWYDLADKHGIMIQNEYLMWNLRGRPSQYQVEYTDWIWQDGNHPSIIIWDALNEQKQEYIGRELIPQLKKLDHTRIWDLGYMKSEDLGRLKVNEIHWYPLAHGWWVNDQWVADHIPAFRFGKVTKKYANLDQFEASTSPIIVNEFGWQWQSRNGKKSGVRTFGNFVKEDITPYKKNYESYESDGSQLYTDRDIYEYFVGKDASPKVRRDFQAYILAIESEILRSTREADGMATFAYLTNNNGYTGDWFEEDIKDLKPAQGLLCQYHTCRPFAVFVDVQDARYLKNPDHFDPDSSYILNVFGVNDNLDSKKGSLTIELIEKEGTVFSKQMTIEIESKWQKNIPVHITMPKIPGGYMLITKLQEEGDTDIPQVSRRYIQVGTQTVKSWPEYSYSIPEMWPK